MSQEPVKLLPESETVCLRCNTNPSQLLSRKEHFCRDCFIRFIRGKQRKQMQGDRYKVRYGEVAARFGPQKVLLALSLGPSSLVLVDVMASLLEEQMRAHKGRCGFEIVLLNIDETASKELQNGPKRALVDLVGRYEVPISFKILNIDSYVLPEDVLHSVAVNEQFSVFKESLKGQLGLSVAEMLALCPNKSSAEDLLSVIYDALVLRTAYVEKCQTVLYGHNMTRLANEVILLTVKGRGLAIHSAIADRTVTFRDQEINIIFPLREVLFAETQAYAKLADLERFQALSTRTSSKITKNMTVRELTSQYFHTLDATGYASTASTVVKTGEKLAAPEAGFEVPECEICGTPVYSNPQRWLRQITVNEKAPLETEEEYKYAEQYSKSEAGALEAFSGAPSSVCYGCTVSLGGVAAKRGFIWPLRGPDDAKKEILNEYVLTDDEE